MTKGGKASESPCPAHLDPPTAVLLKPSPASPTCCSSGCVGKGAFSGDVGTPRKGVSQG